MCWFVEGKGRVYATKSEWLSFWTFSVNICVGWGREHFYFYLFTHPQATSGPGWEPVWKDFFHKRRIPLPYILSPGSESSQNQKAFSQPINEQGQVKVFHIYLLLLIFFFLDQFFYSTLEPNHCIFHHYSKCTLKEDLFSMLTSIFLHIVFICLGGDFGDFVAFIVILCQTQRSLNSTLSTIPTPEGSQGNNVLQEQQQTLSPKYHFVCMSYTQLPSIMGSLVKNELENSLGLPCFLLRAPDVNWEPVCSGMM